MTWPFTAEREGRFYLEVGGSRSRVSATRSRSGARGRRGKVHGVLATFGHVEVDDRSRLGRADRQPPATGQEVLAWRLLMAVGVVYLVAQVALFSSSRPPGWDESVYLSQVMPGVDAMVFLASRARGITLLIAPVTVLGGSVEQVRLFLMVVSAIAMTISFRVWIPLIGLAAPVAAVMFSFTWLALLNGSEVMPNLWAAILGLATTGLVARRLEGGKASHVVLAAAALAAMALTRPTEAAVLTSAIGLYVVIFRRSRWRLLGSLGIGLALGWLPWFVEMSIRFGGPVHALDEAAVAGHVTTTLTRSVFVHLAASDGRPPGGDIPLGGVIWWGLLVTLTIVAIVKARRDERTAAILGGVSSLALAFEYFLFVSGTAPRFMLPVYALVSVPAAIGVVWMLRGSTMRRTTGVIAILTLLPWTIWQGVVADRFQSRREISTYAFQTLGLTIRDLAADRQCSVISPHGWPTIAFTSGCHGSRLLRSVPSAPELAELRTHGREVFVILKKPAPRRSSLGGLTPVPARGPNQTWLIYHVPPA